MSNLIIGPSWIGDMVVAQALLQVIQARYGEVDVLAPAWSAPLVERMQATCLPMPLRHGALGLVKRYRLAKGLLSYQRCFVLPNSFKSALIPFWAKIPYRVGWRGEWRYGLLNDVRVLDKKRYPLLVERYLALAYEKAANLPKPLPRPTLLSRSASALCKRWGLSLPALVLCPGAAYGPSKCWPAHYYGEVARHYQKQKWHVWILGTAKDGPIAEVIQAMAPKGCVDLTGKTTLGEAIDLIAKADKVITNDSGLMHIAAALNRPLVAIYGSTSPRFTPPLGEKVAILQKSLACQPCFKRRCPLVHHQCMQQLTAKEVILAANRLVSM